MRAGAAVARLPAASSGAAGVWDRAPVIAIVIGIAIAVRSAIEIGARAMERWDPAGCDHRNGLDSRRYGSALPPHRKGHALDLVRALSLQVSFAPRVVHVSENRSKHRRAGRALMSYIAHHDRGRIRAEQLCIHAHDFSPGTAA